MLGSKVEVHRCERRRKAKRMKKDAETGIGSGLPGVSHGIRGRLPTSGHFLVNCSLARPDILCRGRDSGRARIRKSEISMVCLGRRKSVQYTPF